MAYLYELEKWAPTHQILNSHQALVINAFERGRMVASNDIRAGGAMVLTAGLSRSETV